MKIVDNIKETKNCSEMAEIMSQITYGCGDCSPDNREQCKECLEDILSKELQEFLDS